MVEFAERDVVGKTRVQDRDIADDPHALDQPFREAGPVAIDEHIGLELEEQDQREPGDQVDRGDVGREDLEQVRVRIQHVMRVVDVLDEIEDEIDEQQRVDGPLEPLAPGAHGVRRIAAFNVVG